MRVRKNACLVLLITSISSLICAGPSQANALADYNNGTAYFQMGRLNEAIRWFDKSIAWGQKGFAEPYINKGFCLQKLGYHDRAILCYNQAIKINPKVAVAYQNRGTAYLHLNRYAESLRDLNQAITMPRPASLSIVTVYIDRGRAYAGLHRWKESFADFDYVMSMQATNNPKVEKLKLAAADEKRKAQALMAQVGQEPSAPSAVRTTSAPASSSSVNKTPSSLPAASSSDTSSQPTATSPTSSDPSSNSSSSTTPSNPSTSESSPSTPATANDPASSATSSSTTPTTPIAPSTPATPTESSGSKTP